MWPNRVVVYNISMENFKQIAEDCLAGKLSGTFVLRNGKVFHSTTHLSTTMFHVYPYCIAKRYYSVVGNCYSGGVSVRDNDVIDFIPDNMQEQIKIDIPEGKVPVMEQTENGVVITWKEKELTYDDVVDKLSNDSKIISTFIRDVCVTTPSSRPFYKKVEVLRKLTNIRNYFGKPDPNEKGWIIDQGGIHKTIWEFKYNFPFVVFAKKEYAEQAIKMLGDELKYLFEPW